MHLARWHYCDARGLSLPIQIGAKPGKIAKFPQARKQSSRSKSPIQSRCRICFARKRYQHRGFVPSKQAPAQTQQKKGQGKKPGSLKAGRGQVGMFGLLCIIRKASSAYLLCICSFLYDAVSPTATMKDHILMPTTLLHQACAWRLPMKALLQPYKEHNQTTLKLLMRCKNSDLKQSLVQPS